MNKVLLVTTVYRVGEKIYPIIPECFLGKISLIFL